MLVPVTEMLQKARAGKYAVAQININNLEWTKSVLATAQELNSRDPGRIRGRGKIYDRL